MQNDDLFPILDSVIEKEYKQKLFLKALTSGKIPARKCLIKNIIYLSKLYKTFYYSSANTITELNGKYDRKYSISHNKSYKYLSEHELFINNLKRYLSNDFKLDGSSPYKGITYIYFINSKVRWDLIDYDLKTNHSNNILIKPNGFVYVKDFRKEY